MHLSLVTVTDTSEVSMLNNFSNGVLAVDLGGVVCPICGHQVDWVLLKFYGEAVSVDNVPVKNI